MSDEHDPTPNAVGVQKVAALIGNGVDSLFHVEHPAAPNVVTSIYRAVGGEGVSNEPLRERGRVTYAFASPPGDQEFIAVVIG